MLPPRTFPDSAGHDAPFQFEEQLRARNACRPQYAVPERVAIISLVGSSRQEITLCPRGINGEEPRRLRSDHDEGLTSQVARQRKKLRRPGRPTRRKACPALQFVLARVLRKKVPKLANGSIQRFVCPASVAPATPRFA